MITNKRKEPSCDITEEILDYIFFEEIENKQVENKQVEKNMGKYMKKIIILDEKIDSLNKKKKEQSKTISILNKKNKEQSEIISILNKKNKDQSEIIHFLNENIFRLLTRKSNEVINSKKIKLLNFT